MNLVFDTQTWIYLANGYNQATGKIDDGIHFHLLDRILVLVDSGKLKILTNEVIILEWDRNKHHTKVLIDRYNKRIADKTREIATLKKMLSEEARRQADNILNEFKKHFEDLIRQNQDHIVRVDDLLKKKSILVPITDTQKLEVVNLAIEKSAPFHRKANSFADAIILLSTAEYLDSKKQFGKVDNAIFVSNNSDDYCEKKGGSKIHPDLEWYFALGNMRFETNLARALKMGEGIIEEIDRINEELHRHNVIECEKRCGDSDHGWGIVEFDQYTKIYVGKPKYVYNPNQLWLDFGYGFEITSDYLKDLGERGAFYLESGQCSNCGTFHLECDCGEILTLDSDEDGEIHCLDCDTFYEIKNRRIRILHDEEYFN